MAESEALLTVPEVAARLRVTPDTVRRWLRHGKLRGVMLGGTRTGYRIREGEIDALVKRAEEGQARVSAPA